MISFVSSLALIWRAAHHNRVSFFGWAARSTIVEQNICVSLFSKYSHVCLWACPSVWVFVSVWEYRHFNYVTPVCICVSVNGETPPYWPRCLWKQDHESKPSEALKLNRSALWLHWIGRTGTLALHMCIVELSALIFTEFEYSTHRWRKPQQHCKVCTVYKIFAHHED